MRFTPLLLALGLAAPASAADTVLALDYGMAAIGRGLQPLEQGAYLGTQLQGRLGRRFSAIGLVHFTPELGLALSWAGSSPLTRPLAGARLGVGAGLEASTFAHVGYRLPSAQVPAGFAPDVGAALDLTLIPVFDVGLHAQYVIADPWELSVGLHGAVKF